VSARKAATRNSHPAPNDLPADSPADTESGTAATCSAVRFSAWRGVIAGFAVGLVAMIWSWNPSLWSDEAATISAAKRSLPELWAMLGSIDLVHGLYYFVLHWWIELFGASAFSIRLPSAIAIGIVGACVFWLGERLRHRSFAVWAVVIFAVLPRVSWAGAEGRAYAFTAMFAAGATLVLLVTLDSGKRWGWGGYALVVLAGVLSNLYVGLLIAAHLISMVWDRRVSRTQRLWWVASAGAAVVVAGPFLLLAYRQAGQLSDRAFGLRELLQNVAVNQWFLGDTPTTTTGSSRTAMSAGDVGSWWLPASVLFAVVSWSLMIYAVVRYRRTLTGRKATDEPRAALVWLLPWIFLPTAVIGLYSIVATPMYGPRYLTFAAPAVALLIAIGLTSIPRRWLRNAAVVLLVLAAVPVYVSQRQLTGKNSSDWISVAQFVGANSTPGDGVYFAPRYDVGEPTVGQTTRGISVAYPDDFAGLRDLTLLRGPVAADNLVGESRYLQQSAAELAGVNTVWVIRRVDYPADDAANDQAFLLSAGFEQTQQWEGPLDVVLRFDRTTPS
jgi:mannosyltransferase